MPSPPFHQSLLNQLYAALIGSLCLAPLLLLDHFKPGPPYEQFRDGMEQLIASVIVAIATLGVLKSLWKESLGRRQPPLNAAFIDDERLRLMIREEFADLMEEERRRMPASHSTPGGNRQADGTVHESHGDPAGALSKGTDGASRVNRLGEEERDAPPRGSAENSERG